MSYYLLVTEDAIDEPHLLSSNSGWDETCDWAEDNADIELEHFCRENDTSDAKALLEEIDGLLTEDDSGAPIPVLAVLENLRDILVETDATEAMLTNGLINTNPTLEETL